MPGEWWIEVVTAVAPSAHGTWTPASVCKEWAMAVAVCCPTCWAWSELKSSMTCKRCGTPLVLPDGRRVDEVASAPPGVMAPPPAYATAGAMAALGPPPPVGFNWVAVARWMTAGYGALAFLGLLAVGFVTQYVTVPVQDPVTGRIIDETVNLRPILLVAAIVVAVLFAVFTWLIGYGPVRVVVLVLTVLATFAALSRTGAEPASAVVGSLVSIAFDLAFGFVLLMSFLAPQRSR